MILTESRGGCSIEAFCSQIHTSMIKDFHYALVWGRSAKHAPQHCGLSHYLMDEDVVQVVVKTVAQQKADTRGYADRAQEHMDKYKEKKKRQKKSLKT